MSSFHIGPITLASAWEPLLHPKIRQLTFPPIPNIDCDRCWMAQMGLFGHRTKCCTYVPTLPNFLVGEILEDGWAPGGDQTVAQWLEAGRAGPLMIHVPPHIVQQYQQKAEDPAKQPGCPLLDGNGRCTVYEHRPPLCIGYHCVYPNNPLLVAFWNSLCSLLELHTVLLAQYLLRALSFDVERFRSFWMTHSFEEIWQGEQIQPNLARELWQDKPDPAEFYKACYRYVREHQETIREQLDAYRRRQLLADLEDQNDLESERAEEIRNQPLEPSPLEPPSDAHQAFLCDHRVLFPQHRWTLYENESYILWYHQQVYGITSDE